MKMRGFLFELLFGFLGSYSKGVLMAKQSAGWRGGNLPMDFGSQ